MTSACLRSAAWAAAPPPARPRLQSGNLPDWCPFPLSHAMQGLSWSAVSSVLLLCGRGPRGPSSGRGKGGREGCCTQAAYALRPAWGHHGCFNTPQPAAPAPAPHAEAPCMLRCVGGTGPGASHGRGGRNGLAPPAGSGALAGPSSPVLHRARSPALTPPPRPETIRYRGLGYGLRYRRQRCGQRLCHFCGLPHPEDVDGGGGESCKPPGKHRETGRPAPARRRNSSCRL